MARFVHLLKYTAEGAKTIGESKSRYEKFEQGLKSAGGRIVDAYGLMGEYDLLVVTEAPDQNAVMKAVLAAMSRGTISSQTLPAVPIQEFYRLVDEAVGAATARR